MARPSIGRRLLPTGAVIVAVVVVDQVTKTWAVRELQGDPLHVIGPIRLAVSYNTGGAFGIGRDFAPLFLLAAVGLVAALGILRSRVGQGTSSVGVSLLLGGAIGNLVDRAVRNTGGGRGAVVDFIDIGFWPVFNVADIAVTCGCALLVLTAGRAQ